MRKTVSETRTNPMPSKLPPAAPPYVRCIQWVPRRFAGGTSPVTRADLVLTQVALAEIRAHRLDASASPAFGILWGSVFEDPTCARPWMRVEGTVRSARAVPEDAGADALGEVLDALRRGVPTEATLLGWYRTHHEAGLYLSPEEGRFHQTRFPQPWQCGIVLAGAGARLAAGVFQPTEPDGLSRSVYTPFYELVSESSEFNGNTRRSFVDWANYQTESQIAAAGANSVSSAIPGARAPVSIDPSAPPDAREAPPVRHDDPGDPARLAGSREADPARKDLDDEWEKIQIQRSLTAVGRSLGPGTLGMLGPPGQPASWVEDASEEAGAPDAAAEAPSQPPETMPVADHPVVIPIRPDAGGTGTPGLVGRSRRRRRLPAGRILSAAAGAVLVAGAAWFGLKSIDRGGEPIAIARDSDHERESAVAGLSLSSTPIFRRTDGEESVPDTVETASGAPAPGARDSTVDPGPDSTQLATGGAEATGAAEATGGAEGVGAAEGVELSGSPSSDSSAAVAEGGVDGNDQTVAAEPSVPPPVATEIVLDDPVVSAYQNALDIFRKELERYEVFRNDFDKGLQTCNPLNLSYRGVRDAFRRLETRYEDAKDRFAGPAAREHEGAVRQFTVTRTHYELTECPMPIGG